MRRRDDFDPSVPVYDEDGTQIHEWDDSKGVLAGNYTQEGDKITLLSYTYRPLSDEEIAAVDGEEREALQSSQLATAVTMYVKSASLPRVQAISVCAFYDEWSGKGVKYTKGQWLRYGDDFAYVEQDHTSQEDWTPEAAPSLYTIFKLAPDGIRIWEQPTRAENAFDTGERCHYPDADGEVWVSKIDGNTTVPGSDDRWWERPDAGTE